MPWLRGARIVYAETHNTMARGSEDRVQYALLAHNFSVFRTFPHRQWYERVYLACAGHLVPAARCRALCDAWRGSKPDTCVRVTTVRRKAVLPYAWDDVNVNDRRRRRREP